MFKKLIIKIVVILIVVVVATGCATTGKSIDGGALPAPDGTIRWTHGSVIQAEGTQIISSTTESCEPVKDTSGNVIPDKWKNCKPQSNHAASDNSPGVKAGNALADVGSKAILAGGMVGAAAVIRPAVTKINQDIKGSSATADATGGRGGSSTATGGSATNTNTSTSTNTNKNCAQSTGEVGKNATVKNCP